MIDTGSTAPDFTLPRDGGEMVTLSQLRPRTVVLYFYPRDDTPGCTKEAIAFSGLADSFAARNAMVLGVSRDTRAKHDKFRDKHALSVALISDTEATTCKDYGVWVEKTLYGKKSMGIERSTFLIDGTGVIRRVWRKVKVDGHAEEVLEAVRAL
ncbi:peroxiredoxin [Brevirhabdus sp.]|uniref:peroxiredoxin n=1 Tax=Brevirhabdus sp. TaxID=2004514 RepID=UPI00405A365B